MRTKLLLILPILLIVGCNAQNSAQKAQAIIGALLNVAQAEVAVVPPADQPAFSGFVALGQNLNGQLGQCISKVGGVMGKNAKFLACFNVFAQGLLSPAELAQLRILSGPTQKKVQLYLTGIVAGVNVLEAALGGTPVVAPIVGPAPSAMDIHNLGLQATVTMCALTTTGPGTMTLEQVGVPHEEILKLHELAGDK